VNILWFSWKDPGHPASGGAEVVLWELSKRLVAEGHGVTILTCGYNDASDREQVDGINIIRIGSSRYIHPFQALSYYLRKLRNRFDIVIEVVNTAPYFGVFFGKKSQRYLFYHQLAEEIWDYETKAPLSQVGRYILEPGANRLLSRSGAPVITISESTRQNLTRYGFKPENVSIISEGIQMQPLAGLRGIAKFERPTMLGLGAMRAMKRTMHQVEAFELAKQQLPELQLKLAGLADDDYGRSVLARAQASPYREDIEYLGKVSADDKTELMRRSHLITVTSVKEGWGLIVSEAASQGTPAVVYDVDGLRDSVRHGQTGLVVEPQPSALASGVASLLGDSSTYQRLRDSAWQWSRLLTFDNAYKDFKNAMELA
jgi:glycosyltransferase involved in cell wall biosynthesis